MSSEAIEYWNQGNEPQKMLIYPVDGKPYRELIVPTEGESFYRDRITTDHSGETLDIQDLFLYLPNNSEVSTQSFDPLFNMGGIGTVGNDYGMVGAKVAQNGYMYITHRPLREISVSQQLFDKEHRENPFLYTAQVGKKAIEASLWHFYHELDMEQVVHVDVAGHSYGGMTGSELAAISPEVRHLILQDVAGIVKNALIAHAKGIRGIVKDGVDTFRYMRDNPSELTPDLMSEHKDHVLDNILLLLREVYGLLREPDLTENAKTVKENGGKVGGILYENSAFFLLDQVLKYAERANLFDEYIIVEDARHTEPNTNPDRTASTLIDMQKKLENSSV